MKQFQESSMTFFLLEQHFWNSNLPNGTENSISYNVILDGLHFCSCNKVVLSLRLYSVVQIPSIYESESPRAVPIVLLTSMSIIASASSWDPGVAEAAALFAAS